MGRYRQTASYRGKILYSDYRWSKKLACQSAFSEHARPSFWSFYGPSFINLNVSFLSKSAYYTSHIKKFQLVVSR